MNLIKLTLLAKDLASQLSFYAETLKLPAAIDPSGERLTIQAGNSQLIFEQSEEDFNGIYHFAFNIPPDQFTEGQAWLAERLALHQKSDGKVVYDFESWNAHAVYFHDPAGNILELIARHDLPQAAVGPFSEQSFLCISEIGVVCEDVLETVKAFQTNLGLGVYRGEANDKFTPLGDEHGLLIVVKRGRPWFADPSGMGAGMNPLTARLKVSGDAPFILSGPPYQITSITA